jgi:hypothetical protein
LIFICLYLKKHNVDHSKNRGFLIGMKLTFELEPQTLKLLVFLIREAVRGVNIFKSQIYPEI